MFFLNETLRFPTEISDLISQTLWKKIPQKNELESIAQCLQRLWPKLAKEHGIASEQHYANEAQLAKAYAAYYLPANVLKPTLILEELLLLGIDPLATPGKWIDFGCGPGTLAVGVDWWSKKQDRKFSYQGFDHSSSMVALARAFPLGPNVTFARSSFQLKDVLQQLTSDCTIVSFMNSITEIFPDLEERKEAMTNVAKKLRELSRRDGKDRFLLLLEPGSREQSRSLSELKDHLKSLLPVITPCLNNRDCGALTNLKDWCHEEADCDFPQWMQDLGSLTGLRKEQLLFSYTVFATREFELKPQFRMVSQRLEQKGQVECFFCTNNGKQKVRVQKSKCTEKQKWFFGIGKGALLDDLTWAPKGDLETFIHSESRDSKLFPNVASDEKLPTGD